MDQSPSCSGISKNCSAKKNIRKSMKCIQTPILLSSSSDDDCIVIFQDCGSNSNVFPSSSTPFGHGAIRKRNIFKPKVTHENSNDNVKKKEVKKHLFQENNGESQEEIALSDSDSDDMKFGTFRKSCRVLKSSDSSDDDCFLKENVGVNNVRDKESFFIDDARVRCRTGSNDSVISDLTNHISAKLHIKSISQPTSDKTKINTPCTLSGRKFRPVIFESDESSSDELSSSHEGSNCTGKQGFLKSLSPKVPDTAADKEALRYRIQFKNLKFELARKLFRLYNEKIFGNQLPANMTVEWNDRLLKTAGYTRCCRAGGIKSCSISLSTKVLDSACRLRDTLMHEMCHAAVWILHGLNGHGPLWQTWAMRCSIVFPEIRVPKRCHNYEINFKYTYKCSNCSYSVGRHSKSLDCQKHICPYCKSKFYLVR